ncbi:ABC-2 type transport system ATP-binding protein [Homoserinimonas aerilata]|uniref:ABC-2 type transport system ATP-binding protein n=1 Tax=Homoserinimonas aerilata TaxID=1162970 RepID=A0A542YH09_9MICO|nr:ABC transporter ATP-binding protein [Homoserinimonas aerilata]TQL47377.1 ABC-2 type transport system ATP-binding protein [Homoserinimonas aerilata]
MPLAIETTRLAKRFGRTTALHGIDLAVEQGAVFGLIGPNGAGKTTLMRVLLDLIRPSSGRAAVLGREPRGAGPALRREIGFLPGELRLEGRISGHELLRHYARISGRVAPAAVDVLAERLGLDLGRQVRTLSKGNKQKLGLVQAFMHRPRLLVLDEPTSGLDPLVQQEFLAMVREARELGQTVFLSSHVLSEIQQAADTVAILRAGRVVTVSDVESLRLTAIRRVRVGIADATAQQLQTALAAIPNVTELAFTELGGSDGDGTRMTARVEGGIDPFLKAIARFTVNDLVAEEPDLEESVLRLYNTDASDGDEAGAR